MLFEQRIQSIIDRHALLRRGSPVIVALSGGADSVALLTVLTRLRYECIAAHCNFHLRGAESIRDMRHAEKIARELGVDIYIREFDVPARMRKTGESLEMACRELRYNWFHELLDRDYSQAIAVAHHREDNIETFLLNLLRSTGLAGLTGMEYRRGYVVRPFLDVSRTEILQYLENEGLTFVTDSSNASNDFKRNRLRNVVIPTFEKHFEGAGNAMLAVMNHLRDSHRLVELAVSAAYDKIKTEDESIDIGRLVGLYGKEMSEILLFEMLKERGVSRTRTDNMVRAAERNSSGLTFDIDRDHFAEFDRGILSLHLKTKGEEKADATLVSLTRDIITPVHISITPHSVAEFRPERNTAVMFLDISALAGDATFEIRHPKRGDRMQPFGMTSDKLVSDILKDAKFSAAQKRSVWLLIRNGTILWIIGLRASAHFTVNPETRRYLRLEFTGS